MAISRPPNRTEEASGASPSAKQKQPTEAQIMAVIKKGGSVASERTKGSTLDQDVKRGFELRLYQSMIDDIENAREGVKRGKKPSRNAWIIAAIEEKLERDGKRR